jgi:hypothetical protein
LLSEELNQKSLWKLGQQVLHPQSTENFWEAEKTKAAQASEPRPLHVWAVAHHRAQLIPKKSLL